MKRKTSDGEEDDCVGKEDENYSRGEAEDWYIEEEQKLMDSNRMSKI